MYTRLNASWFGAVIAFITRDTFTFIRGDAKLTIGALIRAFWYCAVDALPSKLAFALVSSNATSTIFANEGTRRRKDSDGIIISVGHEKELVLIIEGAISND
jgi:hypothetical protein